MNRTIQTYYSIMIAALKDSLAYKTDFFLSLIFRISTTLIMILVWSAVFLSSGSTTIGNFTLPMLYVYFFIVNAMVMIMNEDIDEDMQNDIRDGTITTKLVRPVNYAVELFLSSFSGTLLNSVIVAIPLLIIASLITSISLTPLSVLLFFVEIAVGYLIVNTIGFLIGTLAIYFTDIWGVIAVSWTVIALLSGSVMPLSLFPAQAAQILSLTPFPLLAYIPTVTLLGMITTQQIINSIIVGIAWLAFLLLFAALWWRRSRRDITSAGG